MWCDSQTVGDSNIGSPSHSSTWGNWNVGHHHCGGTMLACRATSRQRPPCFIHMPVKRRCSVFPAFGILPPHTTVSLPAAMAVSPYKRRYSICRSYEVITKKPDSIILRTCCLLTNLFKGLVTTKSSDHKRAIALGSLCRRASTSSEFIR